MTTLSDCARRPDLDRQIALMVPSGDWELLDWETSKGGGWRLPNKHEEDTRAAVAHQLETVEELTPAQHEVFFERLAEFAYATKILASSSDPEDSDPEMRARTDEVFAHIENCETCQQKLAILYATDPFLQDEKFPVNIVQQVETEEDLEAKTRELAEKLANSPDDRVARLANRILQQALATTASASAYVKF